MPTDTRAKVALSTREFVGLMALIISLAALSIDAMLPALQIIAGELGVTEGNDAQLIISFMFAGFAIGQLLFGPLSDSLGRKRSIYLGISVFLVGCVLSMAATSFPVMLLGRVLQGVGAASPRIITTAVVRDLYEGADMARITSLIMAVFVMVPAIAPSIGQGILLASHWRAIFGLLIVQALVAVLWFGTRLPETLHPSNRRSLSPGVVWAGVVEVARNRVAMGYTVTSGLVFSAFIGYLTCAPQLFKDIYGIDRLFPLYFGVLALSVGLAALLNSRLVMRLGMHRLSYTALASIGLIALTVTAGLHLSGEHPPLWLFMGFMLGTFFSVGMLMGNLTALAMEPLGHMAGVGSAVVGFGSTLVSVVLGTLIGRAYDGTLLPLVGGFALLGLMALGLMYWIETGRSASPQQ